ncbi:uncharacterized protein EV420DRAFT_1697675 [Desarmillaria tabescens]|uniref:Uncharacterized protein n=1 Tax=Armillaria tabescens TaxID=1929756 RepID=A0AA39K1S8_ARMTA|nr:uncharacterized protein EV420DRAFT_1697675 [Desarmillaria tabescens]KAK0452935.1 hypothetical protein EV420DRAFT_1697675 [Desarmillaria tabescens]
MALSTSSCSLSPASLVSKKGSRVTITSSFVSIFSNIKTLLAPPTRTEIVHVESSAVSKMGWDVLLYFFQWVGVDPSWSLAMVYHVYPELTGMECLTRAAVYFFLCIGIKCLIMTIDDILDYDIDANVERTKNRALPRGAISIERVWLFFALQVVIGVFSAYKYSSIQSAHFHYFAPIPLSLMFNIDIYMGWAVLAPDSQIPYHALTAAYIGATMWTITYETVYQHQDKVDDVRIGMKSLAILCGRYTIFVCSATTIGFAGLMAWARYLNEQGVAYYVAVVLSASVLLKVLLVMDIDKRRECMRFFLHTPTFGNLILTGLIVDVVVQRAVEGISL